MNQKASQTEFRVQEFDNLQLYLLSVAAGIALAKENMAALQVYVDKIVEVSERLGITDAREVFSIFLGQPTKDSDKVREIAFSELKVPGSSEFVEQFKLSNQKHQEAIVDLLNRHKDIVITLPLTQQDSFEDITREYFWLHAAMLVDGAAGLRKYHLGVSNIQPKEIIDRYERSIKEYYQEYFSVQVGDTQEK